MARHHDSPQGSSSSNLVNNKDYIAEYPPMITNEEKAFGPSLKSKQPETQDHVKLSSLVPLKLVFQALVIVLVVVSDFFLMIYAVINIRDLQLATGGLWSKLGRVLILLIDVIMIFISYRLIVWFSHQLSGDNSANTGGNYKRIPNRETIELKNWTETG